MRCLPASMALLILVPALPVPASAQADAWQPLGVVQFFIVPDEPSVLAFRGSGDEAAVVTYVLRDYAGQDIGSGEVEPSAGRIEVSLSLAAGFYEIEFPATEQRFGIVSLPPYDDEPDPFFAIDTALSWLVRDDAVREGLIEVLGRSGIGLARERLRWSTIHPGAGEWRWDAGNRYETLRRTYRAQGVDVLEMFHDSPGWMGLTGKYAADLHAAAEAWQTIHDRWRGLWHALEIWNEPDIFFGDHLPADQYVVLVRALAYALRDDPGLPLVGGSLAYFDPAFLESAARNDLLSLCDVFSFHTYARAMEMERIAARFRDYLAEHGAGGMPVWITESGRPWRRGPGRPPREEDAASAADIVMKAVEARACGIDRYFAFVYPYYDENEWNFGMMDLAASPLRSMAAYAQAARRLAGAEYVGDLTVEHPAVQRARVFRRGEEVLAVLYSGAPEDPVAVPLGIPVLDVEGIDGRELAPGADGVVTIADGMVYAWLDADALAGHLNEHTEAMRLLRAAAGEHPPRQPPAPLVLRLELDEAPFEPITAGYRLTGEPPAEVDLRLSAFHLGREAGAWTVRARYSDGADRTRGPAEQLLELGGGRRGELRWRTDLSEAFAAGRPLTVTFTATAAEGAGPPARLAIDLLGEPRVAEVLEHHSQHRRLPIEEADRWRPMIVGHGTLSLAHTEEGTWRMEADFEGGDKWAYPQFHLPEDVAVEEYEALLIRVRCEAPAAVRVFLWEGDTDVGYMSRDLAVTPDGRWRTALVRFDELIHSAANAPDPNHRLDLDAVRRISVGFNSRAEENALEVSDLYLISP